MDAGYDTQGVECPFGLTWCSHSNYDMVVKTSVLEDPRRFVLPYRGSRHWQQLYNQRTAAERSFSLLKERLGADDWTFYIFLYKRLRHILKYRAFHTR